jgi:O-antigen/teichoic acid export membrane protein
MTLRQRAVSATLWTGLRQWGGQASNVVVLIALARLLAPESFGLVAYASVVIGFMQMLANAGFVQALVQLDSIDDAHLDTAFWTNLAIAGLLAAGLALAAAPVAQLMGDEGLRPLLPWLSLNLLLNALSATQTAILRRDLRMRPLALLTLASNVGGGAVGVGMAFSGYEVWSLVGQQLCGGALGVLVLWRSSDWRPRLRFSFRHLRDLTSFGSSVLGVLLLRYASDRADRLMIGQFLGAETLGIYVIGARAVRMVGDTLSQTLRSVSLPVFARMQRDLPRLRKAVRSAAELNAFVTIPVYVALASLAPLVVPLVFGLQWLGSVPVLQILVLFGLSQVIHSLNAPLVMALGKPSWALLIDGIGAVIGIPAILFATSWGANGVALAVALRGLIVVPLFALASARLMRTSLAEVIGPYALPLVIAATLGAGAALLSPWLAGRTGDWPALLASGALLALAYLACIRLLAPRFYSDALDLAWSVLPGQLRRYLPRPAR